MAKGSIAAGFIVSILISSVAGGLLGYYALPLLLGESSSTAGVLQTEYKEINSEAQLNDNVDLNEQNIPDTSLLMTTSGNSYLFITFSSPCNLRLSSSFSGVLTFNLSIYVDNVWQKFMRIGRYYTPSSIGIEQQVYSELNFNCITGPLDAGLHNISLTWYCTNNANGNNFLTLNMAVLNYNRSLYVQEIAI